VLAEEKLVEISGRLNIPLRKPSDTLHRRIEFKVSSFKVALTPEKIYKHECERFIVVQGMCV
jgi:hypothetical protein